MTPAAELLREEILARGPISFARFMEVALYHPQHGYYRRSARHAPDPFGMHGDFYTAEQVQPVFGLLIAAETRALLRQLAPCEQFTVVELGAGRGEMAPFFQPWRYVPVDAGRGHMPDDFTGVVFANEFFDALPVHVVVRQGGGFAQSLVRCNGEEFEWTGGPPVEEAVGEHLTRYGAPREDGDRIEVNLDALSYLDSIHRSMRSGYLLAIDYGYTAREMVRFPAGTLMGYRRHQALDDVLTDPGLRDITAHVNFTALETHALSLGWEKVRFESMASLLLRAGEPDQFAEALGQSLLGAGTDSKEAVRRRLQLKTLLYGMGENFRALLLRVPAK